MNKIKDKPKFDYHFGDVLEIQLPSKNPHERSIEPLKSKISITISILALIISIISLFRPEDPMNKASYEEIKKVIEQTQKNNDQNHRNNVVIYNYLKLYVEKHNSHIASVSSSKPVSTTKRGRKVVRDQPVVVHIFPPVPYIYEHTFSHTLPEYEKLEKSVLSKH